ncbi:MAG: hypothetical protein ABI112_10605 [Terracoccus sp.]
MNETSDRRPADRRASQASTDLGVMAPHVDHAWAETFVIEQRLLGVTGEQIGDALATVESHVAESGESARAAFGNARAYARQVAEVHGGDTVTIGPRTIVGSLLGLVAVALVPRALGDWLDGRAVSVSVGDLVVVSLLAVLCLVLFTASGPVIRFLVDHRWAALLIAPALIAAFVGALLALPAVVTTLPAGLVAGVGLAVLGAEVVVMWGQPDDELVNPAAPLGAMSPASHSPMLALVLGPGLVGLMCLSAWALRLAA